MLLDLAAAQVFSGILTLKSKSDNSGAPFRVDGKLRMRASEVASNIEALSNRLRAYIRVGGVGAPNNAKSAMNLIEEFVSAVVESLSPASLAKVVGVLGPLLDKLKQIMYSND